MQDGPSTARGPHVRFSSGGNIPHELLEALLGNPYESQVLVDADGIVRYMSPS